ncbi:fatty acid desaturase [Nitrosomonas communis]|uniref:fatty acid desaturase family protein n=1 Tax=Nitrosomonas communis TaxID=44574 RepID=UPI0026EF6E14|nr:fatty acid desaturase [Nitrosomonas communis]MCO6427276.1 fatty acid desaturase [Nitrosomonas communis]
MIHKIEKIWLRYKGSLRPTISVLLYCQLAYFGGAALILSLNPVFMIIGTLAMAHGMVIAAYMIHDCGHNTLFKSPRHNAMLGKALNWLTGGCYGTYEDLRANHMQHHVNNADVITLDYRGYLARAPIQRKILQALEWLYIPVVEFLMHGALMLAPFLFKDKKNQRLRVTVIIMIRFSLLLAVFLYSPMAYICYVIAYTIFLTILRFMDALQHNYGLMLATDHHFDLVKYRGDRDYEESHTFSNLISVSHPWLNLLTLNFGYHNAHHAKPTTPWHELPKLHRELYGDQGDFVIPFGKQLSSFHKGRVARVFGDENETQGSQFAQRLQNGSAVGANGISFLTPL